jgi:hypothetical protein
MDLKEGGWKSVNWIHSALDRNHCSALVNTVMNLWGQVVMEYGLEIAASPAGSVDSCCGEVMLVHRSRKSNCCYATPLSGMKYKYRLSLARCGVRLPV